MQPSDRELGLAVTGMAEGYDELFARLEVVRIVVELRDGDPVSELSQTAETATSAVAVERVV